MLNQRIVIAIITAMAMLGHTPLSKAAQDELLGDWAGDSICQVKDSPCQDEKVVYHIAKGNDPDQVIVSADKIVNGKAVNMGTIIYTYDRSTGTLLNETGGRVWKFTVKGNQMEGTLTMPDKTVYRRMSLKKTE